MPGYYKIVAARAGTWGTPPNDVFCSREQADSAFRKFLLTLDNAVEYRAATGARIVGPFESKAKAEQVDLTLI